MVGGSMMARKARLASLEGACTFVRFAPTLAGRDTHVHVHVCVRVSVAFLRVPVVSRFQARPPYHSRCPCPSLSLSRLILPIAPLEVSRDSHMCLSHPPSRLL